MQSDIDNNKIPLRLKGRLTKLVYDSQKLFGNGILSVVVYGSLATGEYVHNKSDLNILVLLGRIDIDTLNKSKAYIKRWSRFNINILLLTPEYIKSSLDTFAIEFFDIKLNHICIFGKDYLEDIDIDPKNLRLQCEHELKGKFLKLRQVYIEDMVPLYKLLSEGLTSLMPTFRGLLKLKDKDIKLRNDVIENLCLEYNLSKNVFVDILKIKMRNAPLANQQLVLLYDAFLMQLERLINTTDSLVISK